ncbi:MAG: acetate/propionate family kinase [Verrucomicrobiae bacterium]|nr:acetate/propionate family kinase [Verrucomicrobiae bacterium]
MSILVINAGSTSLKFALFDAAARECVMSGSMDWIGGGREHAELTLRADGREEVRRQDDVPDHRAAAARAIQFASDRGPITAVGHRVVYGGVEINRSVLIDNRVRGIIARYGELAPLHNPPALAAIEGATTALPHAPQVAVFDTAFFAELPPRAFIYPVPYEWYEKWGVRRFGFHGISIDYCVRRSAELLGGDADKRRVVVCHLGGGCSAAAARGGRAVATTLGFSTLEGLMMTTRCGSMDPGLLIHMQRRCGLTLDEISDALTNRSGLLGVSGVSPSLSQVEAAARQGNERARLAFDMFADRVRSAVGSLTVTLGGLDALIFSGGMSEISPGLRAAVCDGLECLGAHLDAERNATCKPDAGLATANSPVRILLIRTREDLVIAQETKRIAAAENSQSQVPYSKEAPRTNPQARF